VAEQGRTPGTLFCDANVLIRLLTGDPPDQALAAQGALEAAGRGRFRLVLPDLVLAELAYVLTGVINLPVPEAAARLHTILDLPGVEVTDEALLRDALRLWSDAGLDFPDAYLAAQARWTREAGVLTFDRDLDRVEGAHRVDPAALTAP
jgi:predicted nucleic acid-binding protein